MKTLEVPEPITEEDMDENQKLYTQIVDAYEMTLSFTEMQQMPGVPKTFTQLSWGRQVLPRLRTARDIRGYDPMMFVYFQSIVGMCELLITRLQLKEMQGAQEENDNRVTQEDREEWMAACKQASQAMDPMKQQVQDALDAKKQQKAREEKIGEQRAKAERDRELCIDRVRKVTRKQFTVATHEESRVDLNDAEWTHRHNSGIGYDTSSV